MKRFRYIILLAGLLCLVSVNAYTQEEEAEEAPAPETEMTVVLVKQNDGSRLANITLLASYDGTYEAIADAEIIMTCTGDSTELELGKAMTSHEGTAEILVSAETEIPKDADGYFNFTISYEGDETFDGYSEDIMVRDLVIELSAELVDSVMTLQVEAYGLGAGDSTIPYHEEEIGVFVQGMLSRLPLEAIWMEEGYGEIEFPGDLPGDADGKLTIYAAVLEHDEYGNVEVSVERQWGKGFEHSNVVGRALWGAAPWWMIIVLVILLSGVWGHYVFAMLQLSKVKKLGDKTQDINQD